METVGKGEGTLSQASSSSGRSSEAATELTGDKRHKMHRVGGPWGGQRHGRHSNSTCQEGCPSAHEYGRSRGLPSRSLKEATQSLALLTVQARSYPLHTHAHTQAAGRAKPSCTSSAAKS